MKQLTLLSLFFFFYSIAYAQPGKTYDKSALMEDLQMIKKGIYEIHPRPFQWNPKETFDEIFADIEGNLKDGMSEAEFRTLCFPIFEKLGCGHSRMSTSKHLLKKNKKDLKKGLSRYILPFNVKTIATNTYILNYQNKDSLLTRGDQLISINDQPVGDLMEAMKVSINSDGRNKTHFQRSLDKGFSALYHRIIPYAKEYNVSVIDSLGRLKNLVIPGQEISKAATKLRKLENKQKQKENIQPKKPSPLKTVFKKEGYRFYQSKKDSSVVVLKIPRFAGKKGKRFYRKVYETMEADPVMKHLVIDLRGNGGGDAGESFYLVRTLVNNPFKVRFRRKKKVDKQWKKESNMTTFSDLIVRLGINRLGKKEPRKDSILVNINMKPETKHHYDGPLYVLIDGYSFSASSVVSSYLKDQSRAVFIGEETGGGKYGTNAMHSPYFPLPNTGMRMRVGLWALDQVVTGPVTGHGIYPDYPTELTIQDFQEETDVGLEKVYELVSQQRTQ